MTNIDYKVLEEGNLQMVIAGRLDDRSADDLVRALDNCLKRILSNLEIDLAQKL